MNNKITTVLVTGGAGYIGSHTCLELLEEGFNVVVVDNLCNSKFVSLECVQKIVDARLSFYEVDLLDSSGLSLVFKQHQVDAVIHFAGLKAVAESVEIPIAYYQNNLSGTISLMQVMNDHKVKNLVFSSSATVYGDPGVLPFREDFEVSAVNPYGRSKVVVEEMLRDLYQSDSAWNISILRYFNPVGAHKSGLIGEDPRGIPNNLMPFIAQVAVGKLDKLRIFGNNYPTKDGTGVRDYIHVVDLALGHISALKKLSEDPGYIVHNLGTGKGYSVLEILHAFELACGTALAREVVEAREGDIAEMCADVVLAKEELHWEAARGLKEMCDDTWRWQTKNPNGFD